MPHILAVDQNVLSFRVVYPHDSLLVFWVLYSTVNVNREGPILNAWWIPLPWDWYSMLLRHKFVYTKLQQSSMCISYPLKSNEHNVIFNDLWLHDRFCVHQLKGWEKRRWLGITLQVIEHATYLLLSQSQLLCIAEAHLSVPLFKFS